MRSKKTSVAATALAVALAGGGFAIGRETQNRVTPAAAPANETPASRASLPAFADLAERVSPAVVNIKATSIAKTNFPDQLFGENFPSPVFAILFPSNLVSSDAREPDRDLSSARTA